MRTPFAIPSRRSLALLIGVTALVTACDQFPTNPDSHQPRTVGVAAHHDDILGDTAQCRSGFVVVDGRYICQ
jgi:hypothetical protein